MTETPFPWSGRSRVLLVLGLVTAGAGFCSLIAFRSVRSTMGDFHPARKPVPHPDRSGDLAMMEDVSFVTSDHLTIRGWYIPSRNRAAVVLGHGFGENRSQMLFDARVLAHRGYGILLFDWRAHGESDGSFVSWGSDECRDLEAALDFLSARPDVNPQRIGVVGFSLGGTIAARVAAKDRRIAALVIEGTFTTLEEATRWDYRKWGPLSWLPVIWAARYYGVDVYGIRTIDDIRDLRPRPILIINGTRDEVPVSVAERLYQAAGEPKQLWLVAGAGHGEYTRVAPAEYRRRLITFFDGAFPKPHLPSPEQTLPHHSLD